MRTRLVIIAALMLLSTAGCGNRDKTAEEYAGKLSALLKKYPEAVNRKVEAEKASYEHLAGVYGRARDRDTIENLRLERNERSIRLADALIRRGSTNPIALSEMRDALRSYGDVDFEATRGRLASETTAHAEFLSNLEDLEVEAAKVQELQKALDELAKPKSRIQRLKDLREFAGQVDTEFDKLVCADLAAEIARLQKKFDAETDPTVKERLKGHIDKLKAEQARRKCS